MPKLQQPVAGKGILSNQLNNIVIQFPRHAYKISTHTFTETLPTVEGFRSEDNVNKTEYAKHVLINLTVYEHITACFWINKSSRKYQISFMQMGNNRTDSIKFQCFLMIYYRQSKSISKISFDIETV